MPGWCQRNVCDWVRLNSNGSDPWTVRVVDAIPDSPNYALKFADGSMLPQSFVDGKMQGPYVGPHSADFLRGALLFKHGGVFMDVGNILFRRLDRVGWKELEDSASLYQICVPISEWMHRLICVDFANHLVLLSVRPDNSEPLHDGTKRRSIHQEMARSFRVLLAGSYRPQRHHGQPPSPIRDETRLQRQSCIELPLGLQSRRPNRLRVH